MSKNLTPSKPNNEWALYTDTDGSIIGFTTIDTLLGEDETKGPVLPHIRVIRSDLHQELVKKSNLAILKLTDASLVAASFASQFRILNVLMEQIYTMRAKDDPTLKSCIEEARYRVNDIQKRVIDKLPLGDLNARL